MTTIIRNGASVLSTGFMKSQLQIVQLETKTTISDVKLVIYERTRLIFNLGTRLICNLGTRLICNPYFLGEKFVGQKHHF